MEEGDRTNPAKKSFVNNGARIWNKAPINIKQAKTEKIAQKAIKQYCK